MQELRFTLLWAFPSPQLQILALFSDHRTSLPAYVQQFTKHKFDLKTVGRYVTLVALTVLKTGMDSAAMGSGETDSSLPIAPRGGQSELHAQVLMDC